MKGNLSNDFSRYEFACRCGCGFDTADSELVAVLQDIRDHFKGRVTINSGCRCVEHNEKAQKAANKNYIPYSSKSQHLIGRAADIIVEDTPPRALHFYLCEKYPDKYGIGKYDDFIHIDTRSKKAARWGI